MFIEAALARQELARHLSMLNYEIDADAWKKLCMAVKRDLQAKRLRPNVPVPARTNPLAFFTAMRRETGSVSKAIAAYLHDGPWTSSGGSFRLAQQLGVDLQQEAEGFVAQKKSFRFLEIGAAWAGYRNGLSRQTGIDIASLGDCFGDQLGQSVFLHFTNLTPWHGLLPDGVCEHPYVTAAGVRLLEKQGILPGSVDILYSQAAAYFETDYASFMKNASRLIAEGGIMIFNHRPEIGPNLDHLAAAAGLELTARIHLGGMNGDVVRYDRRRLGSIPLLVPISDRAERPREART